MYSLLDSISVSETWHLISQGGSDVPSPRHRHTAVLHDNAMWVYGGMNDLQEKSDFWRFDFGKYYYAQGAKILKKVQFTEAAVLALK